MHNSVIVTRDRRAPLPLFPVLKPRNQPRKLSVQRERSWPGLVHDWITGGNKMRFNESSPLHSTRRGSSSSSSSAALLFLFSFFFCFFFAPLRLFRIVFPYIENKSTMETTTSPWTCYCFTSLPFGQKRCDRFFVCRWGNVFDLFFRLVAR